jgi:hypothetical protein
MTLAQTFSTWNPTSVCIVLVLAMLVLAAIRVLILNIQAASLAELHATQHHLKYTLGPEHLVTCQYWENEDPDDCTCHAPTS